MSGAEGQIIHRLLTAIEDDAGVSQRRLSQDIGIAVGSVNWYLKRCISKGLIKLQHAPVKRYLYYLTPQGFDEKSRLAAEYMQRSLELYRTGRRECSSFISACAADGRSHVVLFGDGDLAEIACLSALGTGVQIEAVIDGAASRSSCATVPIFPSLAAAINGTLGVIDAILLTDLNRPRRSYATIVQQVEETGLSAALIHVPRFLNLSRVSHEQSV
jgi:DNA-binding MarR family transcriptional regulator